jgi:hypothetical protein
MFSNKVVQPSTSTRNLFSGGATSASGTNPFGGENKNTNPFGSSSAVNTSSTNANQGSYPVAMMNPVMIDQSNIMYLSSNNPNRHSKLSTFPDNIKMGFYLIENKFENNERYMEAFNKAYSKDDMTELKEQTDEAVKAVKTAWNSLSSVNTQVKSLQEELEKNQTVTSEMKLALRHIKNGDDEFEIPSKYFDDLVMQFEARLTQYKKRIEEMEDIINSSLEKEKNQNQYMNEEGNDGSNFQDAQGSSNNSDMLYQVLKLLYDNF